MNAFPPGQIVAPFGGQYDRFSLQVGDEAHVVEHAAIMQIHAHLDEECGRQEEIWLQRDREFCDEMGISFRQSSLERVLPQNYYVGARPSLISTSIDFWPSITARAGDTRPSADQADQYDVIDVDLYVEVLCKYGPVPQEQLHSQVGIDAEGEANKQVQRLSAATHMCVRRDPTFGGIVLPVQRPPIKRSSFPDAVAGTDAEGSGDYYIYQGRQLRYMIQMNSL